jgi:antitoxin component YwqK of YwqJK toxin-antitoxin module
MKFVFYTILLLFYPIVSFTQKKGLDLSNNLRDTCLNGVIISLSHAKTIYTIQHKVDSNSISYVFYPNASIRELYYYKNDIIVKKIGWHENGLKSYEYHYINGKIEGKVKRYYETGELCCIENYKVGFMDGKQFFYQKNGKIKEIVSYKAGDKVGDNVSH